MNIIKNQNLKILIIVVILLPFLNFSYNVIKNDNNHVEKVEIYALNFLTCYQYGLSLKDMLEVKGDEWDSYRKTVYNKKVFENLGVYTALFEESKIQMIDLRLLCQIYYKDSHKDILGFSGTELILYNGKIYKRNPKLLRKIKRLLPWRIRHSIKCLPPEL